MLARTEASEQGEIKAFSKRQASMIFENPTSSPPKLKVTRS